MDSLTHIALGACIGDAFFERGFGKKAMIWGALAQSIPDIDFVSSLWLSTPESLLAHRGFTHSILFAILIVPVFSLAADVIHRPHNISFNKWVLFFGAEVFIHLFIDAFNNYGIGWLEPFSHARYSFNAIYVVDPFFSIFPVISFIALILLNAYSLKRTFLRKSGIIVPFFYLTYCVFNKITINEIVKDEMREKKIIYRDYFTTPAPLQNWLWYVVADVNNGFYIGFYSLFNKSSGFQFHYFPKNESLLNNVSDHEALQRLKRFSQQYYTVEKWNDTLVFNDLRFGQIAGWQYPTGKFVFHYYLKHLADNKFVVQRGRFDFWDWNVFRFFIKRIFGFINTSFYWYKFM